MLLNIRMIHNLVTPLPAFLWDEVRLWNWWLHKESQPCTSPHNLPDWLRPHPPPPPPPFLHQVIQLIQHLCIVLWNTRIRQLSSLAVRLLFDPVSTPSWMKITCFCARDLWNGVLTDRYYHNTITITITVTVTVMSRSRSKSQSEPMSQFPVAVTIAAILTARSKVNYQLSIVHFSLSTVNSQKSTVNCQLSNSNC